MENTVLNVALLDMNAFTDIFEGLDQNHISREKVIMWM